MGHPTAVSFVFRLLVKAWKPPRQVPQLFAPFPVKSNKKLRWLLELGYLSVMIWQGYGLVITHPPMCQCSSTLKTGSLTSTVHTARRLVTRSWNFTTHVAWKSSM